MQKKLINEYDSTKKMLNKLRSLNESTYPKKSLIEQSQEQRISHDSMPALGDDPTESHPEMKVNNDITVINNVDIKLLSSDKMDMQLTDEQKNSISGTIDNFKSQVSQIVTFEPGMTIKEDQVRLDGNITDLDIKFTIIAGNEAGVYLNAEMLKLDDTVLHVIDRLNKFELSFKQSFEPFIEQRQTN